jgi:hypothetical protein
MMDEQELPGEDRWVEEPPKPTDFSAVVDSGKRQEFSTGSRRDTRDGKGRYDLLPPHAIFRLARHYENGAKKYGPHNWLKGQPISRYIDSAIRHIFKYLEGHTEEDHAIAAAWNMLAVVQTEEMVKRGTLPPELCDLGESQALFGVKQPRHTPEQLEALVESVRQNP